MVKGKKLSLAGSWASQILPIALSVNLAPVNYLPWVVPGLMAATFTFSASMMPALAASSQEIALNNEGVKALQAENYQLAIQKFREALKIDPKHPYGLAKENLAIAYNNYGLKLQDNPKEAIKQFHQALILNPTNPTTLANLDAIISIMNKNPRAFKDRVELGDQSRLSGDLVGAAIEYGEALKLKDDAKIHFKLGEVYRVLNDNDKAIQAYQAAARSGDSGEIEVGLGQTYQAKGDLPAALAAFDRALALKPDDSDVLDALVTGWEEALKADPVAPQNHIGLGKALQYRGDYDQAAAEYKQALMFDRGNQMAKQLLDGIGEAKKGAAFKKHADAGVDLQTRKLYDAALEEYKRALDLNPRSVEVLVDIGTVYQAKEDFDGAVQFYNKALAIEPSNALAQQGIKAASESKAHKAIENAVAEAMDLFKLGKYDEAIAKYQFILQAHPKDAVTHFNLGATYQAKKDIDQAITEYKQATFFDPKSEEYKRALEVALDAKAQPLIDAGVKKHEQKDYTAAIDYYQQALAIRPKNASLWFNLAGALYQREDYVKAQDAYERAMEIDPKGQADDRYLVAVIDEHFGRGQQALTQYMKYIAENSQGKYAQAARERIKALQINIADTLKIKSEKEMAMDKDAIDSYQKALELQKNKQWDEALALYKRAMQIHTKDADIPFAIGTLFQQKGDIDLALNWYQKAIDLDPKNKTYQLAQQQSFELKAAPLIEQAVQKQQAGEIPQAIDLYQKALSVLPNRAMIWRNLGTAYQHGDDFGNARAAYQKAWDLDPKAEQANLYFMAAIDEHYGQGAKALEEYRKYLSLLPAGELAGQAKERVSALTANINDTKKLLTRGEASKIKESSDAFEQAVKLQGSGQYDAAIPLYKKAIEGMPTESSFPYSLGTAYQAKNDLDSAIEWYKKALQLDPKNKDYHKVLTTAYELKAGPIIDQAIAKHGAGDLAGAVALYRQGLEVMPENARTWTNLGGALQSMDDFAKARDAYQKALDLDAKGEIDDWFFIGNIDEHYGLGGKALTEYQKYVMAAPKGKYIKEANDRIHALSINPNQTQKLLTSHEQKNLSAINDLFQNAVKLQQEGKHDEAIAQYKKLVGMAPNEASYWYSMGTCYQANNDIDNAIDCYVHASSLNPKEPSYKQYVEQLKAAKADPLINDAIKKHSEGDYATAISLYQKALTLVPKNARTWTNLAAAYQASDDFARARENYQKALDMDAKGEVDNWYYLAALDEHSGQGKKAFSEYEKYLQFAPKGNFYQLAYQRYQALYQNPNAVQKLVTAAQQKQSAAASGAFDEAVKLQTENKFDEALAKYKEAIAVNANEPSYWYSIGTCYQAKGDVDSALSSYQKAVQLNPKEAQYKQVLNQLKQAKAGPYLESAFKKQTTKNEAGNYDLAGAIADYEAALRLYEDGTTRLNLGTAYQANANLPQALSCYQRAVQLDPKQVDAYYYMGTVYEGMKQPGLALQQYRKYLQVAAGGQNAADAKERIKILGSAK